jgi:hypothetical protein
MNGSNKWPEKQKNSRHNSKKAKHFGVLGTVNKKIKS